MNVFTRARGAALVAATVLSLSAQAASATETGYVAGDWFTVKDHDRVATTRSSFGGRFSFGYSLEDDLAAELAVYGNPIRYALGSNAASGRQTGATLDLLQYFGEGDVKPYIFGGLGAVKEKWAPTQEGTKPVIEAGLGLRADMGHTAALRLAAWAQDVHNTDIRPDRKDYVDFRVSLGLLVPFGGAVAATPAPAPAPAPVAKPVDTDGDGVPDSSDKCPTVAAHTADGCPPPAPAPVVDSDADGVPDNLDACPGTLKGLKVDARGCVVAEGTQSVVLKGVTFKSNSAVLEPGAKTVLDQAAVALSGQKGLKVEIGGHTDSIGDAKKNTALSQARADAVRAYLVKKGVAADQLTAKGYGSSQPRGSNKTKEGRADNRRVELKIVK